MPLFTWCEIQGLFHDFPGPFQANPGPSLSTKSWTFYTCFSKQTLILELLYRIGWSWQWKQLMDKNQACKIAVFVLQHCRIKKILTSSTFLLFLEIKKVFAKFQDFQGPRPKFNDFPGPGNFSPQFQDFPGLPVAALCNIYFNSIALTKSYYSNASS